MNAEIIAVGTELLLGDILNTNAQFLSKELAALGINVFHQSVVGDNPERLKNTFLTAFDHADLVITTGGLGPTVDDLTKETGAAYFGKKLIEDKGWMERLEHAFAKMGRQMAPNNRKQALIPEGAMLLDNPFGTAPGILIEEQGKILVMLPGPPREAVPMFTNIVKPYLAKKQEYTFVSRTLRIAGIGESSMEERIKDIIAAQDNPTIAPYATPIECMLRLTAKAKTEEEGNALLNPVEEKINVRLGGAVYGHGRDLTMQQVVAELLLQKKLTVAAAESCTGGMVTAALVEYPGISEILSEGYVTYSNEAKHRLLGVREETLKTYGAVSHETAAEMAAGVARVSGANVGLSTTGIAGPGGGTAEKPVGLVYVGVCVHGKVRTKEFRFNGDRARVRSLTVYHVLNLLREELL